VTVTPPQPEDPLEILRGHLRSAQEAAQQLLNESGQTPPRGWEPLGSEEARQTAAGMHGLSELLGAVRELLPDELRAELAQLIRQLLAVLRALLDVLISRVRAAERPPAAEVQDIPII
jgi:hypothetical protein